jgi:ABC-type uncharacterized transport system fused permease/ATPase subunit
MWVRFDVTVLRRFGYQQSVTYDKGHSLVAAVQRGVVYDAWSIAKSYWASEEKWSAWGILFAVVAFNLSTVCTSVGINAWNRGFYNALQAFDRGEMKAISDSVWAGCAKTRRV